MRFLFTYCKKEKKNKNIFVYSETLKYKTCSNLKGDILYNTVIYAWTV